MYTTYPTQLKSPEGKLEHYMTQLNSYALIGNAKSFRQGAAAYRNPRGLTQAQRDKFIADASEEA
jgi:hypothetical protein